jgi:hypothetical protein
VPYTPQTWANEAAGGTPVSAARLSYIETGIQTAQATAEAASGTGTPEGYELSTFSGATDDAKLTNALSYAAAQTRIPPIRFLENRQYGPFTTTRTLFSGLKLIGYQGGPKIFELASGAYTPNNLLINCGTGTSSWWVGTGSIYGVYMAGLTCNSTNANTQFLAHESGTLYACEFNNLTHFGFKHVLGRPAAKCLMTQVVTSGHWTTLGGHDVQYTFGGSDNQLWVAGYCNIGQFTVAGADRYFFEFSTMWKTNVGRLYITANNDWRGTKVSGSGEGLHFWGTSFEGLSGEPCNGTLLRIEGGRVAVHGPWLAYAMGAPSSGENGVVQVTGGHVVIDTPTYAFAPTVAESVPMVYQSGGVLAVRDALPAGSWSGLPRVQTVGGTLRATDGSWTQV